MKDLIDQIHSNFIEHRFFKALKYRYLHKWYQAEVLSLSDQIKHLIAVYVQRLSEYYSMQVKQW